MKQVLIYSIQPEHVLNFLKGRKTDEIRKRDIPQWAKDKIERGEVVQGYGYCTMGNPYLHKNQFGYQAFSGNKKAFLNGINILNGKVVFKFQVSGTTKYVDCSGCTNNENGYECENEYMYQLCELPNELKKTCLTCDELEAYGNGADLYAHHFTNITPIEPMELSNFYSFGSQDHHDFITTSTMIQDDERGTFIKSYKLRKAPQSFQSAWVKGE